MSSTGSQFAVDIPVTDLDEDIDDFRIPVEELDNDFDSRRSLDLRDLNFDSNNSGIFRRGWKALSGIFSRQGKFTRLPPPASDDIEMINRAAANIGDLEFDFDHVPYRRKSGGCLKQKVWSYVGAVCLSKVLILPLVVSVIGLTIAVFILMRHGNRDVLEYPGNIDGSISRENKLTLLFSVAGLHPHFISSELMPFLTSILDSESSLFTPFMVQSNPVLSDTNLWTIATGLTPAHNGYIDDDFYDPALGEYRMEFNSKWLLGEPIWKTVAQQYSKAFTFNWVIPDDEEPDLHYTFEDHGDDQLEDQLERLQDLLTNRKDTKINLLLSQITSLEYSIKEYGLGHKKTRKMIKKIDKFIEKVYKLLSKKKLKDLTNVIITSNGGYAPVTEDRIIRLDSLVEMVSDVQRVVGTTIKGIYPSESIDANDLYLKLRENLKNHPLRNYFNVYRKKHAGSVIYGDESERIAPIIIAPTPGYLIDGSAGFKSGYLHDEAMMRSVFVATGPYFGQFAGIVEPFDSVHLFNMICRSLGITPTQNDGHESFLTDKANYIHNYEWVDMKGYPHVNFDFEYIKEKSYIETKFKTASKPADVLNPSLATDETPQNINRLKPIFSKPLDTSDGTDSSDTGPPENNTGEDGDYNNQLNEVSEDGNTGDSTTESSAPDMGDDKVVSETGTIENKEGDNEEGTKTLDEAENEEESEDEIGTGEDGENDRESWWKTIKGKIENTVDDLKEDFDDFVEHIHSSHDADSDT